MARSRSKREALNKKNGVGTSSPTHPRMLAAAERQRQAVALRAAGATFQQIAQQLGYKDRCGAHHAIMAAIADIPEDPNSALCRKLELERLDQLWFALWQRGISGEIKAIEALLKISARRAKLYGWDIERHEHTGEDGNPPPIEVVEIRVMPPRDPEELRRANLEQDADALPPEPAPTW